MNVWLIRKTVCDEPPPRNYIVSSLKKYVVPARHNNRKEQANVVYNNSQGVEIANNYVCCGEAATRISVADVPIRLIAPEEISGLHADL